MKQHKERIRNKYKNLQYKPMSNIQSTKHSKIMYRYVYKINITPTINYKRKEVEKELLHNTFIDKPYEGLEGEVYSMLVNNIVYYLDLTINVPAKQEYKEGIVYRKLNESTYNVIGKDTFYVLQHINKYVHKIKVTI